MVEGETLLQMARRHVRDGEAHVARQREILAKLQADHLPTEMAQKLLVGFEETLQLHKSHLAQIEAKEAKSVSEAENIATSAEGKSPSTEHSAPPPN
jgi:hypothetical protein